MSVRAREDMVGVVRDEQLCSKGRGGTNGGTGRQATTLEWTLLWEETSGRT